MTLLRSQEPGHARPLRVKVFPDANAVGAAAAHEIAELIKGRDDDGRPCVLGLASGVTPVAVYRELIRFHRQGLSFARVVTYNLDEYYPMTSSSPHSCTRFIRDNFLDHVDVARSSSHALDGSIRASRVAEHCERYERQIAAAGGIDLQLLGIGRNGHIGFNEPGSPRTSRTRLVTLNELTRRDAKGVFGEADVPRQALTMGVDTILRARRVLLLAVGSQKAAIVARAMEGTVSDEVPASFLREHSEVSVYLDGAAAEGLSRAGKRG